MGRTQIPPAKRVRSTSRAKGEAREGIGKYHEEELGKAVQLAICGIRTLTSHLGEKVLALELIQEAFLIQGLHIYTQWHCDKVRDSS